MPSDNLPPSVEILSPAEGASFLTTETITFSGSAADVEEGDLTQSLVWTSSLNGQVGTGPPRLRSARASMLLP
jgi:serine protease